MTDVIPNALSIAPPNDLVLLFGTMTMSLAVIAMSSFLPAITAPISTRTSSRLPVEFSLNMTPLPKEALNFVPCASDMACRNVVPSLSVKEPGAFTSPATKKTSEAVC